MPTTRKRVARHRNLGITPEMIEYFLTGKWPVDAAGVRVVGLLTQVFLRRDGEIRDLWREHRTRLLAEWRRRGGVGEPWGSRFDHDPEASRFAEGQ